VRATLEPLLYLLGMPDAHCLTACFLFYGGKDKLHASLATLLHAKRMEQKSFRSSQIAEQKIGAKCFSKEPNFWFFTPKEPIWQP